jgi:hypothetical protein
MEDSVDRFQYEPPHEDEIEAHVGFSTALMEQADEDGVLFDMLTTWDMDRCEDYQRVFLARLLAEQMHRMLLNKEDDGPTRFDI